MPKMPSITTQGSRASQGSQVSAFAVYKNLIPGVKVYEDHNSELSKAAKKRKRKKQKNVANGNENGMKSESKPKLVKAEEQSAAAAPQVNGSPKKSPQGKLFNPASSKTPPTGNVIQFLESKVAQSQDKTQEKKVGKKRKIDNNAESEEDSDVFAFDGKDDGKTSVEMLNKSKKKSKKNKNKSASAPTYDDIMEMLKKKKIEEKQTNGTSLSTSFSNKTVEPVSNGQTQSSKQIKKAKKTIKVPGVLAVATQGPDISSGDSRGINSFKWLIHPKPVTEFFSNFWEKKPLLLKRGDKTYYGDLLTSSMLDKMLRENTIRFSKNIDVTSYTNGERETHNPVGRAMPPVVWDYYANGCSIRLLNPQAYIQSIWKLNSSLQDYLGTFVGANVYLTPSNSQGFAPHWDDIEAFVLQLEGKKRWRVYEPLEKLPKASSANLTDDMIGKPVLDVTLEPGDMLYFPRGFIHQANATDQHSLHITISCYQNTSYSDFLKEYLPMALDRATMESVAHREGLPRDYLQYMGVAHADREDLKDKRSAFMNKIKKLTTAIIDETIMDFTADQMGKKVIWDSLPPFLDKSEIRSIVSSDVNYTMVNGVVTVGNDLDMDKQIRLLRPNCVRLVIEDGTLRLYYSTDNSLEYHGEEIQFIEMLEDAGPLVEFLIAQYPKYVKIKDLPNTDDDDDLKLQIVSDLWEKGILRTK